MRLVHYLARLDSDEDKCPFLILKDFSSLNKAFITIIIIIITMKALLPFTVVSR